MKRQITIYSSLFLLFICMFFALTAYAQDETAPIEINSQNTVISISGNHKFDYTSKKPDISVKYVDENGNSVSLKNDIDYKLVYANNKNAGIATVNINGINKYTGTVKKEFKIEAHSFSKDGAIKCELSYTTIKYSSTARKPAVTLYYTKKGKKIKLQKGIDYKTEYLNNINAGTATVRIKGINNFSGTINKNFTISRLALSDNKKIKAKLSYSKTTYSGKAKRPSVEVFFNDKKLKNKVDYTLSFSANTNPGRATVKISGKGNFSSKISKTFIILPVKPSSVKASDIKTDSLKISWKKQNKISGYQLLVYNSKKKKYVHHSYLSAGKSSITLTKLSKATVYKFKLRAYKTISKKKYFGNYSKVITAVTKPAQVNLTSVSKNGKNLIVEWSAVNCSGYEISYTTDKNFKKGVKTVKVNSSSKKTYTVKKLNKSKIYYVKVRAFVKYNKKYYYGKNSSKLSSYYSNLYATYTSRYENNANRTNNLRIASKAISGTIVGVGETFSFNKVVGPRTTAKGYKSAHVFSGGGVVNGVGGGVCQVASTMFNCVLKANVSVVERHQHSQRVAYVPLGRDAAIYGTSQDFKWKNNTKYPIRVEMKVKDGYITCSFYTSQKAKPSSVKLTVSQSGNHFTLKRSVKGKVNYSCHSYY